MSHDFDCRSPPAALALFEEEEGIKVVVGYDGMELWSPEARLFYVKIVYDTDTCVLHLNLFSLSPIVLCQGCLYDTETRRLPLIV